MAASVNGLFTNYGSAHPFEGFYNVPARPPDNLILCYSNAAWRHDICKFISLHFTTFYLNTFFTCPTCNIACCIIILHFCMQADAFWHVHINELIIIILLLYYYHLLLEWCHAAKVGIGGEQLWRDAPADKSRRQIVCCCWCGHSAGWRRQRGPTQPNRLLGDNTLQYSFIDAWQNAGYATIITLLFYLLFLVKF